MNTFRLNLETSFIVGYAIDFILANQKKFKDVPGFDIKKVEDVRDVINLALKSKDKEPKVKLDDSQLEILKECIEGLMVAALQKRPRSKPEHTVLTYGTKFLFNQYLSK